jgi:hypothetical protein
MTIYTVDNVFQRGRRLGRKHVITHRERINAKAVAHQPTRQRPGGQNFCFAHGNDVIDTGTSQA